MRADDASTKREVAHLFLAAGSPRVLSALVAAAGLLRLGVGRWSVADAIVVAVVAVLVGPAEWVIHRRLLHADVDAWTSRRLGLGSGHAEHHRDPTAVSWLLLPAREAAVFAVILASIAASWSLPLSVLLGAGAGPATLTAVTAAWAALWHYEWTHLLVHSRYRPRSRSYARLARNHRLHHFRNENYWLGVTSNLGDRLAHTLPGDRADVPLSNTARSLQR